MLHKQTRFTLYFSISDDNKKYIQIRDPNYGISLKMQMQTADITILKMTYFLRFLGLLTHLYFILFSLMFLVWCFLFVLGLWYLFPLGKWEQKKCRRVFKGV